MGPPRFLWHPCAHAPLIDPGETSPPRLPGGSVLPSAVCTALALTISLLSGLIHAACSLPVYASQLGSPRNHATLGSRQVASLCRAGLSPAGYLRKVSVVSTSRPPCTSFPGARTRRGHFWEFVSYYFQHFREFTVSEQLAWAEAAARVFLCCQFWRFGFAPDSPRSTESSNSTLSATQSAVAETSNPHPGTAPRTSRSGRSWPRRGAGRARRPLYHAGDRGTATSPSVARYPIRTSIEAHARAR